MALSVLPCEVISTMYKVSYYSMFSRMMTLMGTKCIDLCRIFDKNFFVGLRVLSNIFLFILLCF